MGLLYVETSNIHLDSFRHCLNLNEKDQANILTCVVSNLFNIALVELSVRVNSGYQEIGGSCPLPSLENYSTKSIRA